MAERHEVIVAGAGHNGLLVAAYLAKAGVDVCVVEKNEFVGGGVVTRELAVPGFKLDLCSIIHVMIQPNPLIQNDELNLFSKYGLKYIYPDMQSVIHFYDGSYITICMDIERTVESIAKFSEKDADAYRRFYEWSLKPLELLLAGMYSPPPPFGSFVAMMDQSKEGRDLLRAMMVSALDIINDWFENEKVKIALTRWISECMIKPQTKGTGLLLFIMIPVMHKYGGGMPVGGSGELSESLARCILDLGGTIKTSCPIKRFSVENGECTGIVLEDGSEILASKAVLADLNIKQVFPGMVTEESLPAGFTRKVDQLVFSDFECFQQGYALNEPPKYKAGEELDETFFVEFAPNSLVEYLRCFDDLGYGILRHNPFVACQTLHDKTRAPEGKHTLYLYEYAPYDLKDGGPSRWDEIREQTADEILDFLRKYTTNMGSDNIIGRWIQSPLDLERHNNSFMHGDFAHIGAHLFQSVGNRPMSGWNYHTPIKNLVMCGPSTHPGVGVIGGGRAAVQVVMEDLGIDFESVISK